MMVARAAISPLLGGLFVAAGILATGLSVGYAWSQPPPAALAPADAALEKQLAALRETAPQPIDPLAIRVSAARDRLPSATGFEARMRDWSRNWTTLARSADRYDDIEVRHYALSYSRPALGAWPDIVKTVEILCAQPGLTLDSLSLAAAPEGTDAFVQAQITLTARLRP
jgi:hypothetical protein